jgi:hypothetical protein
MDEWEVYVQTISYRKSTANKDFNPRGHDIVIAKIMRVFEIVKRHHHAGANCRSTVVGQ